MAIRPWISSGHWMPASASTMPRARIEADDPVHRPHVEQHGAGGELLAAHGVPPAGHADRLAGGARRRQRGPQRRF